MLLNDLVNADMKGLINMAGETFHLVNSEFGRHDSLPRRDLSYVEPEFFPVRLRLENVSVQLN